MIRWVIERFFKDILEKLDEIYCILLSIEKEQLKMADDIQGLDDALNALSQTDANLATAVQQNTADVQALLAEVANLPVSPDLQSRIDKVTASTAAVQSAVDALKASDLLVNPVTSPSTNS